LNEVDESNIETPDEEVECYLGIKRPKIITSLLSWWQVSMIHNAAMPVIDNKIHQEHEHVFPTLFKVTMSYLAIQGTAIPSERVFSSSAETLTKCHSHLQPKMIEALQMLKYLQWKSRLEWMEKLQVVEDELIAEAQSEVLADLMGASETE